MSLSAPGTDALASRILAAADDHSPTLPITADDPAFGLAEAYRVSARILERRVARGERPVGWKIGFTNRTIWDEYGVHAPIWGPMYDSTVAAVAAAEPATCPIRHLSEPRIEPEIAFRISAPPHPDMDEADLLACIESVGHGIEIVQSVFPAWRFEAADTVAAFALHGCYRAGPFVPIDAPDRARWMDMLRSFEIVLGRDGAEVDRGQAANVLGGPLSALRHFVRGLAEHPVGFEVRPGDIVTTGTVTRAFPIAPGERWRTRLAGVPLPGLELHFS